MDKRMYRYASMRFNLQLLALGIIRIGTLHDFRGLEHKKGVCDPKEGKKVVVHNIEDLYVTDPNDPIYKNSKDLKALEEFRVIKLSGKNTTFKNVTLSKAIDAIDCFILCTSEKCSKHTMKLFEEADSCLQIINVNNFFHLLTETLNALTPVLFRGVHEVKYQNREESWNGLDWGVHPSVIKDAVFEPQGELRAIWQPISNKTIKPIIIGNYRLGSFCKIISI